MNRTLKLATVVLIALAAALAGSLMFLGPEPAADASSVSPAAPGGADSIRSDSEQHRTYPSSLTAADTTQVPDQLPASLEGTDVPAGWDRMDASGSLISTPELRQLFEHYLAALGEESLAQLVGRIQNTLAVLPEPARSEATEILGAYLDYKLELGDLESASGGVASLDPDTMARHFAEIRALRRHWLDAETASAFFAMEEAVDDFQLAQRRIRADDSLSDEARAEQLQAAEQALPPPIREARQQTRRFSEYQQVRQQLGDDPEALQAWRENAFGGEAAARLAQVEADEQDWDDRWQAYQQDRAELETLGLAGPEREDAIRRLRERYFEGPERYRAEALDSMN